MRTTRSWMNDPFMCRIRLIALLVAVVVGGGDHFILAFRSLPALPNRWRHTSFHDLSLATHMPGAVPLLDMARHMAAEALQPVLFPPDSCHETRPISAEHALQRSLRSLARESNLSSADRRWLRASLSALILGTSTWRMRYEYLLHHGHKSSSYPMDLTDPVNDEQTMDQEYGSTLAMVDFHIAFLRRLDSQDICQSSSPESHACGVMWPTNEIQRLSVQYSLPFFLIRELVQQYGFDDTEALAQCANQPGPITLRRNCIRCPTDQALYERLREEVGHDSILTRLNNIVLVDNNQDNGGRLHPVWKPPPDCFRLQRPPFRIFGYRDAFMKPSKSIWSLSTWRDGWFEVQDVGSQIIAQATDAHPGNTIIDFCAGNGGKTLALASLICRPGKMARGAEKSYIWAHDVVPERIKQIQGSLPRAGILDCGRFLEIQTTFNATEDLVADMADVCLVDVPCSSTGVLRRRPSQRWTLTEHETMNTLPSLQLEILQQASQYVKANGGKLIYATCSLLQCENEMVADAWEKLVMESGDDWIPWDFDEDAWPIVGGTSSKSHHRRLLPHIHDSDGFFIARWKRK